MDTNDKRDRKLSRQTQRGEGTQIYFKTREINKWGKRRTAGRIGNEGNRESERDGPETERKDRKERREPARVTPLD